LGSTPNDFPVTSNHLGRDPFGEKSRFLRKNARFCGFSGGDGQKAAMF
jgi:hypothetical protein